MQLENLSLADAINILEAVGIIQKNDRPDGPCETVSATKGRIGEKQIVVLDRGFVYVGDVSFVGDFVLIENAKNLRIWGTSKGLGELRQGPLSGTKLDDVGTVRAPLRALISLIDVDAAKWNASK
jgi:hypothetical protein